MTRPEHTIVVLRSILFYLQEHGWVERPYGCWSRPGGPITVSLARAIELEIAEDDKEARDPCFL